MSSPKKLRISARQSELAQLQAFQVGDALKQKFPALEIEFLFRESLGDKNLTDPLWKIPEKGVFTEDFKRDLIEERTDLVVHSWKDLPTEVSLETTIAATLPREDQRDIFLFKKTSFGKKNLNIFSSSPRRAYNLTSFLDWALPFAAEKISFLSVRGNIATRISKWLQDENADGLIVAKAAIDRLLQHAPQLQSRRFISDVLKSQLWMVTPLRANPNAAAQGALAIEIKKSRTDLYEILEQINCAVTFKLASEERNLLKAFGGGCHLALGMSCLSRDYGHLQIVRGKSPAGDVISENIFIPHKKVPEDIQRVKLEFEYRRTPTAPLNVSPYDALYVSKAEAWNIQGEYSGLVWAAGLETWKKLSQNKVWVYGCHESLGETENTRVDHYYSKPLRWGRLSHSLAASGEGKEHLAGYDLEIHLKSPSAGANVAYVWTSPHEFDEATQRFPEIKQAMHICGPGRTYVALRKRLLTDERLFIEIPQYT